MKQYKYSADYDDPILAELYDQFETYTDDIDLIRKLLNKNKRLKVLECFSGTGRMAIPLAKSGHVVTCIEKSVVMNERAIQKVKYIHPEIQDHLFFKVQDVTLGNWGNGFDLVILGANALFELSSAEAQQNCIKYAHEALVPGGIVFIDNQNYQGDWNNLVSSERITFEGSTSDGTYARFSCIDLSFDQTQDILHMKRIKYLRKKDGKETHEEYHAKKRPISGGEVRKCLENSGFQIIHVFGKRNGSAYMPTSERAIFWAIKNV